MDENQTSITVTDLEAAGFRRCENTTEPQTIRGIFNPFADKKESLLTTADDLGERRIPRQIRTLLPGFDDELPHNDPRRRYDAKLWWRRGSLKCTGNDRYLH
jgi:hypothetical protein